MIKTDRPILGNPGARNSRWASQPAGSARKD